VATSRPSGHEPSRRATHGTSGSATNEPTVPEAIGA
jgi:hypothetical protein